jgi:hypothetical protein
MSAISVAIRGSSQRGSFALLECAPGCGRSIWAAAPARCGKLAQVVGAGRVGAVASLSFATDLGRGLPMEHSIRRARLALPG